MVCALRNHHPCECQGKLSISGILMLNQKATLVLNDLHTSKCEGGLVAKKHINGVDWVTLRVHKQDRAPMF